MSSPEGVALVTDWLQKNKQQGRRALARHLCQALDLNDTHTGKPRLALAPVSERLSRAIAIDLVIAWRVMLLTLLGREVPEMPCELFFSAWECNLLEQLQPLVAPETLRGAKKGPMYRKRPA